MAATDKVEVLNPISLFNTVGQELEDILLAQEKSKDDFLKILNWTSNDLTSIKKLSKADISTITTYFGIDGLDTYLLNFQQDYAETERKAVESYRENKKLYTQLKTVTQLLRGDFNEGMDILEDISDFFGVEKESKILEKANHAVALYRTASFNPDSLNLYAWMRRGELDFYNLKLSGYNKDAFVAWIENGDWRNHFTNVEYFKSLPAIFSKFGVGLVYTTYLDKTVYGCVRWFEGKPLIQISDREKSLAVCWHTLFHEIGHVLLHENDTIFEGEIGTIPKTEAAKKEGEANLYAYGKLFGGDGLRRYVFLSARKPVANTFVPETAREFNVSNMFVAYWMKRAHVINLTINDHIPSIVFDK